MSSLQVPSFLAGTPTQTAEGWSAALSGQQPHYYRRLRAVCGRMLLIDHPDAGYQDKAPHGACPYCMKKLGMTMAPSYDTVTA